MTLQWAKGLVNFMSGKLWAEISRTKGETTKTFRSSPCAPAILGVESWWSRGFGPGVGGHEFPGTGAKGTGGTLQIHNGERNIGGVLRRQTPEGESVGIGPWAFPG